MAERHATRVRCPKQRPVRKGVQVQEQDSESVIDVPQEQRGGQPGSGGEKGPKSGRLARRLCAEDELRGADAAAVPGREVHQERLAYGKIRKILVKSCVANGVCFRV